MPNKNDEQGKAAKRAYNVAYQAAHRDEIRAQRKAHREANREEIAAAKRAYYVTNRERLKAKAAVYNATHREEQKAYQRERYATKYAEVRASNRASRQRHCEKRLAGDRRYYQEHREERRAKSKQYYASHTEERRAYTIAYYARTREKQLAQKRQSYWENPTLARMKSLISHRRRTPETRKIWYAAYVINNRVKLRMRNMKRRVLKRNVTICDFTQEQWNALQITFKHRCAYCGKYAKDKLTQDHITPLSKGGNHTLSNIVPACRSCNSKKHDKDVLCPVQPMLL